MGGGRTKARAVTDFRHVLRASRGSASRYPWPNRESSRAEGEMAVPYPMADGDRGHKGPRLPLGEHADRRRERAPGASLCSVKACDGQIGVSELTTSEVRVKVEGSKPQAREKTSAQRNCRCDRHAGGGAGAQRLCGPRAGVARHGPPSILTSMHSARPGRRAVGRAPHEHARRVELRSALRAEGDVWTGTPGRHTRRAGQADRRDSQAGCKQKPHALDLHNLKEIDVPGRRGRKVRAAALIIVQTSEPGSQRHGSGTTMPDRHGRCKRGIASGGRRKQAELMAGQEHRAGRHLGSDLGVHFRPGGGCRRKTSSSRRPPAVTSPL